MCDIRLVTGILTVMLLGGQALPASADQTFWTMNTGHIPPPVHSTDAGVSGDIYYYGCGGYGQGNGRGGSSIARQQQPRPYGFGFAPERNPAPRHVGVPIHFGIGQPARSGFGGSGFAGSGFAGSGCGGYAGAGHGYRGSNFPGYGHVHPVNPINPVSPQRMYPQHQKPT